MTANSLIVVGLVVCRGITNVCARHHDPADVNTCGHTSYQMFSVQNMFAIGGMQWKCGVRHFSLLVWLRRRLWFLEAGCQSWLASCPDIRIVKAHY